ncbi:hypothetical protein M9H77_06598 [Catharanthus roseus]|uniref:Uncharacterized protein n=1 Tax=Catharanthus roseus TaxID=4058 RepID=A0ACC0BSS3_CATRO|nr:hypothetical protein M9H77_06598 [Catharanthus roseus]
MPRPVRAGHPGCPLRKSESRERERNREGGLLVTLVTPEADSEGVFRSTLRLLTAPRRDATAAWRPFVCPVTVHLLCLGHLFGLISADGFYRGVIATKLKRTIQEATSKDTTATTSKLIDKYPIIQEFK